MNIQNAFGRKLNSESRVSYTLNKNEIRNKFINEFELIPVATTIGGRKLKMLEEVMYYQKDGFIYAFNIENNKKKHIVTLRYYTIDIKEIENLNLMIIQHNTNFEIISKPKIYEN